MQALLLETDKTAVENTATNNDVPGIIEDNPLSREHANCSALDAQGDQKAKQVKIAMRTTKNSEGRTVSGCAESESSGDRKDSCRQDNQVFTSLVLNTMIHEFYLLSVFQFSPILHSLLSPCLNEQHNSKKEAQISIDKVRSEPWN